MNIFLKTLGVKVAKAITKEFIEPHGDEDTWPKQPLRTVRLILKPNMHLHKY